jgi:amino acid transporter
MRSLSILTLDNLAAVGCLIFIILSVMSVIGAYRKHKKSGLPVVPFTIILAKPATVLALVCCLIAIIVQIFSSYSIGARLPIFLIIIFSCGMFDSIFIERFSTKAR